MARIKKSKSTSPGTRLQIGAKVLDGARVVDTRLVRDCLQQFQQVHRSYASAQRKVDVAESEIRVVQARLAQLDTLANDAIDELARRLVADGEPIKAPFEGFGGPSQGRFVHLRFATKAATVHHIVGVLREKDVSETVKRAAEAAEKVARKVDDALTSMAKLEDTARKARRLRDAGGQKWESALFALRHNTQAAAARGAPELYTTLFPPPTKAASKTKPAEQTPADGPAPPTPAVTPNAA